MLPDSARAEISDPGFEEVGRFIANATGHARLALKNDLLRDKIARRLDRHGLSIDGYLEMLRQEADTNNELDELIAELTVGETSFFRHAEHFEALRDSVLPACLKRNAATRQLRIWSAGCANGAEAYSIAILVRALLGEQLPQWTVSIVGSDINRAFLAEAEKGLYSAWILRDVPAELRPAYFTRHGNDWTIRERYRSNVRFVHHNLISGEFPAFHKNIFAFDIIMCRNVMIYFDEATNSKLAERLAEVLVDGGFLFNAPTDFNPRLEQVFALEKVAGMLLYRRRPRTPGARPAHEAANAQGWRAPARLPQPVASDKRIHSEPKLQRRAHRVSRRPDILTPARTGIEAIVELADSAQWDAAEQLCAAFLNANSCDPAAHYYHALIQHYSGSVVEAERALKRAIYLDRNFALAHYQLGLVRKEARALAQSKRSFGNALSALKEVPDECVVSPCGQITALALRDLAARQLELLRPS